MARENIAYKATMKYIYKRKVDNITANSSSYKLMRNMQEKGKLPEKYKMDWLLDDKIRKNLPYSAKEMLFKLEHNQKIEPTRNFRCQECMIEFPTYNLMILHAETHFRKTEGEEIKFNPYKY